MISIAMTTYNGENYIRQQLLSILNQSVPADELIICDDCSKDGTVSLIEQVISEVETTTRILLIKNEQNLGYIGNFYHAISRTNGDYIFLADQDDIWHYDKIEKMIQGMQSRRCSAICSNFALIDAAGNSISDKGAYRIHPFVKKAGTDYTEITFQRLVFGNIVQGCTYCFTKEVKQLYLKLNNRELIHDHQIMFVAALIGDVFFYNRELIDYRIHTSNAIGFGENDGRVSLGLKKPSRQPFMVRFMKQLDALHKIPLKWYYIALYYLRIPHFVSKLRKV